MRLLLVKLLLSPALVGGAWLGGRRWGPRVAGLLIALPIVAGPILLFYAVEQGAGFAAAAARSTLLGLVPLTAFCLVQAAVARAAIRLPRRLAAPLSLLSGWGAFLLLAALLRPVRLPAWACTAVGAAALAAGVAVVPAVPPDGQPPLRHHPALELLLRMAAAALLVTALTGLAASLGATWSGLLTPFPVASSVVVIGAHLADGPESLRETLRGFLLGLFGFVAFLTVLAGGLEPLGVAASFTIGLAGSVAVAAAVGAWSRPSRREPGPARP
jgi:hypothetical protein